MITIVAVETVHVGCVTTAKGVEGALGTALITWLEVEIHIGLSVFLDLILYVAPAARPLKVVELCHIVPSMLYCRSTPNGDVTTIVPVIIAHVGWISVAKGVSGGVGTALTVKDADETQV